MVSSFILKFADVLIYFGYELLLGYQSCDFFFLNYLPRGVSFWRSQVFIYMNVFFLWLLFLCLESPLLKAYTSLCFYKFFKFTTGLWSTSNWVLCFLLRLRILLPQMWFFSWSINVTKCINFHMLNQPYNLGGKWSCFGILTFNVIGFHFLLCLATFVPVRLGFSSNFLFLLLQTCSREHS